jgi:hypothetical protein
VTGRL